MSHRYTSDPLRTHDVNLLYKHRERLEPTANEQFQLFRAIIENGDVRPGWFWFRDRERPVASMLLTLVRQDSSDNIRSHALELMTTARMELPKVLWPSLVTDPDSTQVQQSAMGYLGALGDEETLTFLDSLPTNNESLSSSLREITRLKILARLDPDRAFSELIARDEYVPRDEVRSLMSNISEVKYETLLKGTESSRT
jgi:hypothetical protein